MKPPLFSVETAEHCFGVQFHPQQPIIAAATITGAVELHSYSTTASTCELLRSLQPHEESCRVAKFFSDRGASCSGGVAASGDTATRLLSTSSDCTVALSDIEKGSRLWHATLEAAGNVLQPLGPNRFAVGDDEGVIAIYDARQDKPAIRFSENGDFISDMVADAENNHICATSGDGTLAVYDVRKKGKLFAMSDFQEDEFLSLTVVKQGMKVVCGSQTGILAVFSWGDFGDQKDRIKGHPLSVDAMVRYSEDVVLTGSSDGKVRLVSVYHKKFGNRVLGTIGEHGDDDEAFPVECLAMSPNNDMVASVGHSQPAVLVWSTQPVLKALGGEATAVGDDAPAGDGAAAAEDEDSDDSDAPRAKKKRKLKKGKKKEDVLKAKGKVGFFGEL